MTVSKSKRPPAPTSVIEPHPTPSSHELQRIRDVLATDGFNTESDEYGRRARVAERIEDQINKTREHVREIERTSAQAHRDYADEVSYDEHVPTRDCSNERGEYIAGWLIQHGGWTPPSGLAFTTPAGVKAYSRDAYEIGRALAAVFGSHIEPHASITARMVSEDLMHVKDQRSTLPDVSTPADLTAEVVNLAADVVKLLHIDNGRREGAATIPVTVTYLRDQAEQLQAGTSEGARPEAADGDGATEGTKYTRDELVALCTDGVVAHGNWRNRDTGGAQRQLGEARALLAAGCDFFVLGRGSLKTDEKTIRVAIEWHGFSHFEDGYGTDDDTYYIPTRARLDQVAGNDWY